MNINSGVDVRLGSPTLPSAVKRVRTDHRGHVLLTVDTEDHDLLLFATIATGIRENPEVIPLIVDYADVAERADEAEASGEHAFARSLRDEASDLLGQIEAHLDDSIGGVTTARLRPAEAAVLVSVLTPEAVSA